MDATVKAALIGAIALFIVNVISVITAFIGALAGLIGVWIGNKFARNTQSEILNKQREWELDDLEREWKRNKLYRMKDDVLNLLEDLNLMYMDQNFSDSNSIIQKTVKVKVRYPEFFEGNQIASILNEYLIAAKNIQSLINNDDKKLKQNELFARIENKLGVIEKEIFTSIDSRIDDTYK